MGGLCSMVYADGTHIFSMEAHLMPSMSEYKNWKRMQWIAQLLLAGLIVPAALRLSGWHQGILS